MIEVVAVDLADAAHGAALVELLDAYARDPAGGGQPLAPEVRVQLVPRLAARNDYVGVIAWCAGAPVGLANAFEGFSTFAARPLLNVHDIVVLPAHRRQGIAAHLLDALEPIARARDCCKLTLEVLDGNAGAMALYDRCGYRSYALDPAFGHARLLQKWLR